MNRNELVSLLAFDLGLPKTVIRRLLAELFKTAIREIRKSGVFVLPGIGSLSLSSRKARAGRNPQTGALIRIAAPKTIKFRADKRFQDRMQGFHVDTMHFASDLPINHDDGWSALPGEPVGPQQIEGLPAPFNPRGGPGDYWIVKIFYATDREPTAQNPLRFGPRRSSSGQLHLGTCEVSIPHDHRMAKIERPTIWRLYREDPKRDFVIREIAAKEHAVFFSELAESVRSSEKNGAFVFIHGFRVAFNDAVYRTAQIAYDLGFSGAPVLYSWPSNGALYEYTGDINNNDWTVRHLAAFLKELVSCSDAQVIHLIAHSMGNRALAYALDLFAGEAGSEGRAPFHEIVLTAPDIDADTFRQLAGAVYASASRVTLYCSSRDRALKASKRLNGSYPRAGDCSNSVVVVQGVDTIDASAVDTNLTGHFYYAENRSVLSDIFNLLESDAPPDKRFGIRSQNVPPPMHWKFAP
jgi:esterase/lipase superfamily enzyme/nucleoid DNA-binding protein